MLSSLQSVMTEMPLSTFDVILAPQLFLLKIINGNLEEDPALLANNVLHNMLMIGMLQLQMHPTNLKILPHLMFQPIQPKMLL